MYWAAATRNMLRLFLLQLSKQRSPPQTNQESKGTAGVALAAVPPRLARDRGPTLLVHHGASPFKIGPSERLLLCCRSQFREFLFVMPSTCAGARANTENRP